MHMHISRAKQLLNVPVYKCPRCTSYRMSEFANTVHGHAYANYRKFKTCEYEDYIPKMK
jgi:hypothetical protein